VLGTALGMGEPVLELFYPRLQLVDQVLQRLHRVVANWCHCEREIARKPDKVRIGVGRLVEKKFADVGKAVVCCDSFKMWMVLQYLRKLDPTT